jgi:hypothetical protein
MASVRAQLAAGQLKAPAGASWFVNLVWMLIDLDEPELVQLDLDVANCIWDNGHTISWNLGQAEVVNHDPTATEICNVLAVFLGDGHCENAYEHGD